MVLRSRMGVYLENSAGVRGSFSSSGGAAPAAWASILKIAPGCAAHFHLLVVLRQRHGRLS